MPITAGTISFRIEGYDAPGSTCPAPDGVGLGIQQGREVVGVLPSSTEDPRFRGHFDVEPNADGVRFLGPYVHGPAGDRFLYLAWIHLKSRETMARIKLRLADIDQHLLLQARDEYSVLVGRVALTNAQGKPASGSVRPPLVEWIITAE